MALLDLILQGTPARCPLPENLPVNALLIADDSNVIKPIDKLLSQGFSCIKMKVGRQRLENDIDVVNKVLSRIQGKASLRLDANRQWSLQQAMQFCHSVDLRNIEYIEEPTRNPIDHYPLAASSLAPIALDETIAETPCDQFVQQCYRAIILKPSVVGGFEKTAFILRWARKHGLTPVISSAFQTSLATRMYMMFAILHRVTQIPLGLDTLRWFQEDLLSTPFVIKNGTIPCDRLADRPKIKDIFLQPLEASC
jgi:o-succinylbenzoate synthase